MMTLMLRSFSLLVAVARGLVAVARGLVAVARCLVAVAVAVVLVETQATRQKTHRLDTFFR